MRRERDCHSCAKYCLIESQCTERLYEVLVVLREDSEKEMLWRDLGRIHSNSLILRRGNDVTQCWCDVLLAVENGYGGRHAFFFSSPLSLREQSTRTYAGGCPALPLCSPCVGDIRSSVTRAATVWVLRGNVTSNTPLP